tara:strand:+ start:484 stop:1398 length:915 start_codon:yes stop_codon:yes gene_type:complete
LNLYFKKYFFIIQLFIFSLDVFALNKQFPADNYDYKPVQDIGIRQYEATSLHGTKKIVLTFDDGPNTHVTPKILDLLNKYNVKATFFINTSNLDSKKIPIAYRILEEGHILASHDFDHRDNNKENENVFREGLLRSIFDIKKLERNLGLVKKGIYFRFPYGYYGLNAAYHHMNVIKEVSKKVYDENCINFVFWDIDTKDWGPGMTSLEISQNVKSYMMGGKATTVFMENNRWVKKIINIQKPLMGGVVLLHDKREETYYATESILKMANDLNWDVVPLSSVKEFSFDKKECLIKKDMSLSSLGN